MIQLKQRNAKDICFVQDYQYVDLQGPLQTAPK